MKNFQYFDPNFPTFWMISNVFNKIPEDPVFSPPDIFYFKLFLCNLFGVLYETGGHFLTATF